MIVCIFQIYTRVGNPSGTEGFGIFLPRTSGARTTSAILFEKKVFRSKRLGRAATRLVETALARGKTSPALNE